MGGGGVTVERGGEGSIPVIKSVQIDQYFFYDFILLLC